MKADQTPAPPSAPKTIDQYIAGFPAEIRELLEKVRQTIREAAPEAEETWSYEMPALSQEGTLVHFAAFKKHIGLYPRASAVEAFKEELAGYATTRGTVQFPFDQPIPFELITKIVQFRVKENREKAGAKGKKDEKNKKEDKK
ncbi:MAG TPA: DUF1801 domain-containing protein [Thermoanaerobaculia bacterium]|nr:DUF1801 domain-containing protein [Thermoanaerobaculia bacterium]